jgi:hypothetical protein
MPAASSWASRSCPGQAGLALRVRCPSVASSRPEVVRIRGKTLPPAGTARGSAAATGDLGVIQVGMIAALAADQLEHVGVAAFHPAAHDAGRLAPQVGGPAVAGLASKREGHVSLGVKAQPRVTSHGAVRAMQGGTRTARQLGHWSCVVSGVLRRRPDRPFHLLVPPGVACPQAVIAYALVPCATPWHWPYCRFTLAHRLAFCMPRYDAAQGL